MSTLRRTVPLIERGLKTYGSKGFHETRCIQANARLSPKVQASQRPRSVRSVTKAYDFEESLPPTTLLDAAKKTGALVIETEKALDFLRKYQEVAEKSNKSNTGWVRELCTELDVTPSTVALLAGILRKCSTKAQLALAKKLMLSASELGEKSATFEIILNAQRNNTLHEYQAVLNRLGLLAKNQNNPQAMTILGKIHFARRANAEALAWLRKATQPPTGNLDFNGAGDALVLQGRLLLDQKDVEGAKAIFQKAALDLDDPDAYFYLSQLQDPGSPEQHTYLMKAATSGISEAWHNLGVLELEKISKRTTQPTTLAGYGMAREWFEVAAVHGFGLSMLNLAQMCNSIGDTQAAESWLLKAENQPSTAEEAARVRQEWARVNSLRVEAL